MCGYFELFSILVIYLFFPFYRFLFVGYCYAAFFFFYSVCQSAPGFLSCPIDLWQIVQSEGENI